MLVYLSVMFLCCILLYAMRNDDNKKRPLAIAFGLIWLMISLQDGWGGDHDAYVMFFDQLKGMSFRDLLADDTHGEIGYKIVMSLMPSAHFGMVVGIGVWCFAMAFFFYHFVPQKWWFFAILFVFLDKAIMMGMVASFLRMAIANTFLIFAVYNIWNRKRWMAALLIGLGSLFHLSVLFFLPIIFVGQGKNRIQLPVVLGIFAGITIFFMISPSSWFDLVETVITGSDAFEQYEYYLENQDAVQFKGVTLLIVFYWVYLLAKITNQSKLEGKEYLMMYLALIRIAFDLLPAVGLSTRFFYFIDIYFFAGMMTVLNRLPQKDYVNKAAVIATLLLMFWFTGFRVYARSEFFLLHWATYNPIF